LDGERIRWNVLRNRRAGPNVGTIADGEGGDEARVRADEGAGADLRLVLVEAVVVARDRTGADVRTGADRRVAKIREVVGLRPLAQPGLLELDEVADVCARPHVRLRAQMTEGAEDSLFLDHAVGEDAVRLEQDAVAEGRARDVTARADDAVAADDARAFDHDVRVDDGIGADRHRVFDIRGPGVEDGDAALHEPIENTRALHRGRDGKLLPVVDAERLPRILHGQRFDAPPAAVED